MNDNDNKNPPKTRRLNMRKLVEQVKSRHQDKSKKSPQLSKQPLAPEQLKLESLEPRILLSADLAVDVSSQLNLEHRQPGEHLVVNLNVENNGDTATNAPFKVDLYASLDGSLGDDDILLGSKTFTGKLSADQQKLLKVPLELPETLAPANYTLIAKVDGEGKIAENDESNNVSSLGNLNVEWSFGAVSGHKGSTVLNLKTADGTEATFKLTGGGQGTVDYQNGQFNIALTGTTARSSLLLTVVNGSGPGTIGSINSALGLSSIKLSNVALTGDINVNGKLAILSLGNVSNSRIAIAGQGAKLDVSAGNIENLDFQSATPVGKFIANQWLDTDGQVDKLTAPSLASLRISGDFQADLNLAGADKNGFGLRSATIGGVSSGDWNVQRKAGTLTLGSTSVNWHAAFGDAISTLRCKGDLFGSLNMPSILTLQVDGDINAAEVNVGADLGADGVLGGDGMNADTFSQGRLNQLIVKGDVNNSNLRIGVNPIDGIYGNNNDVLLSSQTSPIKKLLINGTISPNSRVIASAFPAKVQINGRNQKPEDIAGLWVEIPLLMGLQAALSDATGNASQVGLTRDATVAGLITNPQLLTTLKAGFDAASAEQFSDFTASVGSDGRFTLTPAQLAVLSGGAIPEGAHTLHLIATDQSGNSLSTDVAFILDTTLTGGSFGVSASDALNGDTSQTLAASVTLQGTTEAGATVKLGDKTAVADQNGAYSLTGIALNLGNNVITLNITDPAGNATTVSRTLVRSTVTLSAALTNVTGAATQAGLTKDVTTSGQVGNRAVLASLKVGFDNMAVAQYTDFTGSVGNDGRFTLTSAQLNTAFGGTLSQGAHTLRLIATDQSGNSVQTNVALILDTTLTGGSFGVSASDALNGDTSQTLAASVTLQGTTEAGATVKLGDKTAVADQNGAYSLTGIALNLGNNVITLDITDTAGNATTVSRTLVRSTVTLSAALTNVTGAATQAGLTKDATTAGQVENRAVLASLKVGFDNMAVAQYTDFTGSVGNDGRFTLTPAQLNTAFGGTLSQGAHTVRLIATDQSGNSVQTNVALILDTTLAAGSFGVSASDALNGDTSQTLAASVTLQGTTEAGATVKLGDKTAVADQNGAYSLAGIALNLGNNVITLDITDTAGNATTVSRTLVRSTVTLSAALTNVTGAATQAGLTKDATTAGQVENRAVLASLKVGFDNMAVAQYTDFTGSVGNDGQFTLTPAQLNTAFGGTLSQGAHTVRLIATDQSGNSVQTNVALILDTTLTAGSFGVSASDALNGDTSQTLAASVTLQGTTEAGATVKLGDKTAVADQNGAYSLTGVALTLGNNDITLNITDPAGNTSTASRTVVRVSPALINLSAALANATGAATQAGLTRDITVSGQVGNPQFLASFKVGFDNVPLAQYTDLIASVANDGAFTLTPAQLNTVFGGTLTQGAHTLHLIASDSSGNDEQTNVSIILDTVLAGGSFGVSIADALNGDVSKTIAATVTLQGQAEAGSTVQLGSQSVVAGNDGVYTLTNVALNLGDNVITLNITDPAGNSGSIERTLTRIEQQQVQTDAVLNWNNIALHAIQMDATDPPLASRTLAMLSLAQYDTLAAIQGTPAYLVQRSLSGPANTDAALLTAAHRILSLTYPAQKSDFDEELASDLSKIPAGAEKDTGIALGLSISDAIWNLRENDGYNGFDDYSGSTEIGQWRPTGPTFDVPDVPFWRNVTPFALTSGNQYRPPAPPALDTAAYATAVNEVKSLGSATSTTRTADQTQMALFWADGGGSYTPPGHWNQIAAQVASAKGNSLSENVRLFAQLNVALADAGIACWDAKYFYELWRPETAIQEAEFDNNATTTDDDSWRPLLITPPHPEYVSGHSTFSAAAATVLAASFGDNTAFATTAVVTLPGVVRNYTSFSQAADEAGRSRIYGGIHYEFTNQAGNVLGEQVANAVLTRFALTDDVQAPVAMLQSTPASVKTNLTLSGQVLDNLSGVASAQYRIDNGALQNLTLDSNGNFTITTTFALDGSVDGNHSISIIARDVAGNLSSAYTRSFVLDTRVPEINLTSLAENDTLTGNSRLTGAANGTGTTLTQLTYRLDNGITRSLIFDAATGTFDAAVNFGALTVGDHTLTLTAVDAAGNQTLLNRTVKVDALAPFNITNIAPVNGSNDVGVTQRPQISFSRAVDPATLTSDSFYATGPDGSKLAATVVPALDGSFAWLFFTNPMPGGSQITLHVDGAKIRAVADGAFLDADGNGTAGGKRTISFNTVSTTPVVGTKLVGKVVDPGPDLQMMTLDDIGRGADGIIHTADDVFKLPIAHAKVYILGLESQFVYTDANGNFELTNVPAGEVKVAIDGRTATNAPHRRVLAGNGDGC